MSLIDRSLRVFKRAAARAQAYSAIHLEALLPSLVACSGMPATASAQQQKINKKNLVIKEWNSPAGSSKKVLDHQTIYNADK